MRNFYKRIQQRRTAGDRCGGDGGFIRCGGDSENNFPSRGGRKILFCKVLSLRLNGGKCFFRPDMMRPISRRRRKLKGQIE